VTSTGPGAAAQWQIFWAVPAALAAVILIVFGLFFENGRSSPDKSSQVA